MQKIIPVDPFDFIIFGGIGNLSARKLIPALYYRQKDGEFTDQSRIICVSRSPMSPEEFRNFSEKALINYVSEHHIEPNALKKFLDCLSYIHLDAKTGEGFERLEKFIRNGHKNRIFYLAVSPDLFGSISQNLMHHALITPESRIVVEKPIGHDLASAQDVNDVVGLYFSEHQIFRIDHYLGKETVQNLMALRFANALYEPQWNASYIDHIQITVAETIGLEDRVSYYDKAGALRDMVQNHLLQLLCLVAMEPPSSLDADSVRDEKLKVLRSLKPMTPEEISRQTVRGQYGAGFLNTLPVKSYVEELGEKSTTETFVAFKAEIANWRWGGVPFYLRTGKRLHSRISEIVIQFREIPHSIFKNDAGTLYPNQLVIRLQPDEGIKQFIMIKDPGVAGIFLRPISLDMSFSKSFHGKSPDSYERLLMDVMRGTQTLFMRRDEVEAAWTWIDPILKTWKTQNQKVFDYTSGSWGPEEALSLLQNDGRIWRENNS